MTELPSEEKVRADLGAALLGELGSCVSQGFQRWSKRSVLTPDDWRAYSKRTRASTTHDLMVEEARAAFAGREAEGIQLVETGGLFLVSVHGRYSVRFKKLRRRSLRTSNWMTAQQELLQDHQLTIDGLEPINLVAGYHLDPAEIALERVALVLLHRRRARWAIDLTGAVAQLPAPSGARARVRVRQKEAAPPADTARP